VKESRGTGNDESGNDGKGAEDGGSRVSEDKLYFATCEGQQAVGRGRGSNSQKTNHTGWINARCQIDK